MKYHVLGKTGLSVSAVGFGGIPIQKVDENGAVALIDSLIEQGINFIDTARAYTISEELIGKALEGRRDKFILASKSMAKTAESMRADIETSLKNLRTDYIDLYQIHNIAPDKIDAALEAGGLVEALFEAKAEGKIRHIGLTAHSLETFRRALELDFVETIMFPYNIVETHGEELIAECHKRNVGFICMKPLAGGAIEDATLAMRFICQNPAVDVVIPGMESVDEVKMNCLAASDPTPLSDEELARIEQIRDQLGTNFCRRCNYCAPCTVGINIPSVFLFSGYIERYGLADWARERYATLPVKASACIECGVCEQRCPYHLPIRQMMKKSAKEFNE
jgi:predicted aldo/keto reductase-like oxidoreductase